jgi:aspartyl-tRNA(Asn)/glutamyl-tRNA(Gln) amidotransferase subunit A
VTAAASGQASRMDEIPLWDGLEAPSFTAPWNLTGYPAMTVCTGFGDKQLPLAVQIGGKPFAEATLLRAAHALETAMQWRARRPALAG